MSANELTLTELTLTELTQKLDAKEVSACEAARAYLDRIASADPDIGAYLTVTGDIALKAAAASDKRRGENAALSPLDGVPMAVKDAVCVNGVRTTAASKMLENYVPPYSATVYSRLSGAGAVLLGKCNMDEFAMGVSGETSYFYPVKNPFDPQRTAGGSSGGSAAAVAADMTAFALGTDSGGSVRGPAAFCGVVGLKPTFGLISRYGVIPYASSLDAVGILSKTVADCAAVLSSAAGYDPLDTLSAKSDIRDFAAETGESAAGLRIGLPKEYLGEGIAPDIRDMVIKAADKLRSLGAAVKEMSLPHAKYALAAYYVLGTAEAGSNMARYDGLRYGFRAERPSLRETYRATRAEGFGDEVKRRIILGTFVLSSENYADYYEKARKVRALIIEDFKRAFADFDILLTPTAAGPAFKLGEDNPDRYMADICTVSANMAGIPALSVPAGLSEGMPVALQLMGPAFSEKRLFRVAGLLEGPRLRPGA